jgi:DNA (cytosine-5)-methyltransferase 1
VNYYNEFDPKAAEWLRVLIRNKLIPEGHVDTRSITEVRPDELTQYTQCHFFAGIAGWSKALELANVPSDTPLWTGSCPCQPFSAAGKQKGIADERHLWPVLRDLIAECRPPAVLGEQVASKAGRAWLATVRSEMEELGYAVGAGDLCAAGIGAPHIRQRLWFGAVKLAHPDGDGWDETGRHPADCVQAGGAGEGDWVGDASKARRLADTDLQHERSTRYSKGVADVVRTGQDSGVADAVGERRPGVQRRGDQDVVEWGDGERARTGLESGDATGRLADAERGRLEEQRVANDIQSGQRSTLLNASSDSTHGRTPPSDPHWGDVDWLFCRDGKWRPVEPRTFPLGHGIPGRVGLLRGYGNAIVPPLAAVFIEAFLESTTTLA